MIISYATHFDLVWSSKGLTSSIKTKCAIWAPVLGSDEYFVGHFACSHWQHPCTHLSSIHMGLLIIKSGGSDPKAMREPLGFECKWSLNISNNTRKRKISAMESVKRESKPQYISFWKAIAPQGYTAIGDIALPINGDDHHFLDSGNVPKYVCIRETYATKLQFRFKKLAKNNSGIYYTYTVHTSYVLCIYSE